MLLNILCGFIKPDNGNVVVNGNDLTKNNCYIYDAGIIINSPEFVPYKKIIDNLYDIASILKLPNTQKILIFY